MNDRESQISVIIITHNEANNIRDCLAGVDWADEIIVVDAESSDNTVTICEEFAARAGVNMKTFVRPWPGYAAQRQFALEQATGVWVLSVDADERVPPELAEEIRRVISNPNSEDGYYMPRLSTFLGKFMRHIGWYQAHQMRLFRRTKARVIPTHVHEGFAVDGRTGYLDHDLIHLTHRTLEESLARLNRYSSLEARDRAGRRVHWWDLFLHPLAAFWNKYVANQGWRDGMHGLVLALITAMVKLALYMKLWEAQQQRKNEHFDHPGRC